MWQDVLDLIDSVEFWLVQLPALVQIPLLLVILIPVCWWSAKVIDRVVEFFLRKHSARDLADTTRDLAATPENPPGSPDHSGGQVPGTNATTTMPTTAGRTGDEREPK